jgi:KUP system potassium uptake protein
MCSDIRDCSKMLCASARRSSAPSCCWRVAVRYGFMDFPDVALALELCAPYGLQVEATDVSYFLSREKIIPVAGGDGMALWRDRVFAAMARNAGSAVDFFNIPTNRVVELGTGVEI